MSIILLLLLSIAGAEVEKRLNIAARPYNTTIGVAINNGFFDNAKYKEIVKNNFDFAVPEYACHWARINYAYRTFAFKECDKAYNFAKSNKLKFRFHAIIWYNTIPPWILYKHGPKTPEDKLSYVKDYIKRLYDRYGENTEYWEVANEVLNDNQNDIRPNGYRLRYIPFFGDVSKWLKQLFKIFHEVVGNKGKSVLNDYSVNSLSGWTKKKADAMYNIVKSFKYEKVPIDAVGFQFHILLKYNLFEGFRENIRRYAKLGVEVLVSEITVACGEYRLGKFIPCSEFNAAAEAKQKNVYRNLMTICKEEPNCKAFSFWGVSDKSDGRDGFPLLYDSKFKKKAAFHSVLNALQ